MPLFLPGPGALALERSLSTAGPLGTIPNTDLKKYTGGLGAEPKTSAYDATVLGSALNTENYPNG